MYVLPNVTATPLMKWFLISVNFVYRLPSKNTYKADSTDHLK